MASSPRTRTGTKKLSEVARHICRPAGITSTGWPAVASRLAQFGIPFDLWQQGAARLILAKRSDGLYAAGVGGAVLSIPRQAGKTYLVGWVVFALCTLTPGLTVIWTAHHTRTSNETFGKMRAMARRRKVAPYIEKVRATNGEQAVLFKNGSRILFGARDQGFGLGFDMVDILVVDEAQRVKEVAMNDMVPATNAAPNGLVLLMGTPPRPTDDGKVFASRREDALGGDPDTLYIELSADADAKVIDWTQVAKANPSYPHRTGKAAILRMQKMLGSDDNFRREAYGIWRAKTSNVAFTLDAWRSRVIEHDAVPKKGRKVFAVVFAWDGSGVALAGALRPDEGPIHVEAIQQAPMSDGTRWLVDWLAARHEQAAQIVVYGKGFAESFIDRLREEGVRNRALILVPTFAESLTAHAMLDEAVKQGSVTHVDDKELERQATTAQRVSRGRDGVGGGFMWQPPDGDTCLMLNAVTFAHWGGRITKRTGLGRAGGRRVGGVL